VRKPPGPLEAMLDPKLLLYFVEVAETASFSRAAERLNVTQSWLSRQVKALETQIGFKLFDRTSRTVILTERGREMLARAQTAVDHVRGVQALAAKLGRKESALAIGLATYALTNEQRLELVDDYLARYPQVRIDTRIDSARQLAASLVQGELDLMFAIPLPRLLANEQIVAVTVASGGIDVIFPRGDAFENCETVLLRDVAQRPVSAFSKNSNAELFALIFEPAAAAGAAITGYSDYSFYRNLAEQNAVTLMPSWQPLPAKGLARRPLVDHPAAVDLACMRLRPHSHPALERFWAITQERAEPN
jgi:DNA-binding transcriptional LysR family regulator